LARLAQWIIPQFYSGLAWAYDPAVRLISCGQWYRWAFAAEHFIRDQPVLDVGCGRGHLLTHLAKQGFEVVGVDKSPQMVRAARRRLEQAGLAAKVFCADARALPLPDASVGTIINTFFYAGEETWTEYARVLRPGGRWVIVSGPRPDRFCPELLGLYLLRLFEHGFRALRRRRYGVTVTIPQELFPHQRTELVQVGRTPIFVVIFGKN